MIDRAERAIPEEKRKLLKFINVFAIGGTELQFLLMAESLDPARFDLHVACLHRHGPLLDRIERLGVPLEEYPIQSLYKPTTFRQQFRLARYLRRNRIRIVHTYNFYPNVFGIPAARLAGVSRIVASVRDTGAYLNPLQARVQSLVCSAADAIVANAEAVRRWLIEQGHAPGKIAVIRNGIDLSRFESVENRGRLHAELGVGAEAPLVAVVARLSPVKGIDDFVRAASVVATRVPEARFVLFGNRMSRGQYRREPEYLYAEKMHRLACELGIGSRVFFAGCRTDVTELLPELAVSVLPSHTEGLPNAVLESMAAGVPVVATNVGGVPELITHESTGLLVPPRDPGALASAISRILSDRALAASLAAEAARTVKERFSLGRMVRETEDLYTRLEARQGGRRVHA
jgi:glycosyltransferase involved in cell wall biosynthesis